MLERVHNFQPLRALPAGTVEIKIARHPFTGSGMNRHPYWALSTPWSRMSRMSTTGDSSSVLTTGDSSRMSTTGDLASNDCLPWPDAVVKRFKEWKGGAGPSLARSRQAYEGQLEVQAIARELAKGFGAACR